MSTKKRPIKPKGSFKKIAFQGYPIQCTTSQQTGVRTGTTDEIYFVCSFLSEQLSGELGEHG